MTMSLSDLDVSVSVTLVCVVIDAVRERRVSVWILALIYESVTTVSLTDTDVTVSLSVSVSVVCLCRRYHIVVVDCVAVWERRYKFYSIAQLYEVYNDVIVDWYTYDCAWVIRLCHLPASSLWRRRRWPCCGTGTAWECLIKCTHAWVNTRAGV